MRKGKKEKRRKEKRRQGWDGRGVTESTVRAVLVPCLEGQLGSASGRGKETMANGPVDQEKKKAGSFKRHCLVAGGEGRA